MSTRDDGEVTEGLQRGSTLQSQTSLAALLHSQSSEHLASAALDSHKASDCQLCNSIALHPCEYRRLHSAVG